MNKNDGGTAFPFTPTDRSGQIAEAAPGMSLRDWFAGQALAGELAQADTKQISDLRIDEAMDKLARDCFKMADAMLKARETT